jgi:hypothetical protein
MLLRTQPLNDVVLSPAQSATIGIAAIAKLQGGYPEVAALLADRVLRQSPTLPYRGIHIVLYGQGVLAIAQRASGEGPAADLTIEQAIESGLGAQEKTSGGYPPLLRQLAVHHALSGEFETALAYFKEAVDSGWRAEYLDGRKPGNDPAWREFTSRPEYLELKATIEAELSQMQSEVEDRYTTHFWEKDTEPFSAL